MLHQPATNVLENSCYRWRNTWACALFATFISLFSATSYAQTYNLIVQPILAPERSISFYKPLADYLSLRTGENIRIIASVNFPAYWETMKKGKEYDIILDAAHFTDFRIKRLGYKVLAKVPDTVSYSLVTDEENLILDAEELISKPIATMLSPGLGGIRLSEIFPNPLQQPIIIESSDSISAVESVKKGKVAAAIIPTPLLNSLSGLNTIITTDPVPHVAISVSPRINSSLRKKIKKALVDAVNIKDGRAMLDAIRFPQFVSCEASDYDGQAKLLFGVWGY